MNNLDKQNMCGYACINRSCRHVKDSVVHVIVQWITQTHRYCMHISVNVYCTSMYKEVGRLKSETRQCWSDHEAGNFFTPVEPTLRQTDWQRETVSLFFHGKGINIYNCGHWYPRLQQTSFSATAFLLLGPVSLLLLGFSAYPWSPLLMKSSTWNILFFFFTE